MYNFMKGSDKKLRNTKLALVVSAIHMFNM